MRKITVFGAGIALNNNVYIRATDQLAKVLVEQEISLVYGGETTGLSGGLADAVLCRGGEVIGVIPERSVSKELANKGISVLHIVKTMQERNMLMAELGDGYMALPGGIGTQEDLIEVLTWAQFGNHQKPVGLLNIDGYYDMLLELIIHNTFLEAMNTDQLIIEKTPALMIQLMQESMVEYADKWNK